MAVCAPVLWIFASLLYLTNAARPGGPRAELQHLRITQGEDLVIACPAPSDNLDAYRWVFIRRGTKRPQVVTSGRRVVVGEQRLSVKLTPLESSTSPEALELTLKDVKPQDAGVYMCWRHRLMPEPQIDVTVIENGDNSDQPQVVDLKGPLTVPYGAPALLNCSISPSQHAQSQVIWLRDGHRILSSDTAYRQSVVHGVDDDLYVLRVTSLREDAVFSCLLTAFPASKRDHRIRVPKDVVESLTSEPSPSDVQYGQTLTMTCTASGNPGQIVWLKGGALLDEAPGRHLPEQEHLPNSLYRSVLRLDSFSMQDNGHYVCYFRGASRDLLINIESRQGRLVGLEASPLTPDQPLVLSCRIQYARDEEYTVQWQVNDTQLVISSTHHDDSYDLYVRQERHNITRHDIIFRHPGYHLEGEYTCSSPYGTDTVTVHYTEVPSLVEKMPPVISLETGQLLHVVCLVRGKPNPRVTWMRQEESGQWLEVSQQPQLFSKKADLQDSGRYSCVAANEAGLLNVTVTITIREPLPEIVSLVASEVFVGEDLYITCVVSNWLGFVDFVSGKRSLKPLSGEDPRYSIETVRVSPLDDKLGDTSEGAQQRVLIANTLRVESVTEDDQGVYSCHAGPNGAVQFLPVVIKARPPHLLSVIAVGGREGRALAVVCAYVNWHKQVAFLHNDALLEPDVDLNVSVINVSAENVPNLTATLRQLDVDVDSRATVIDTSNSESYDVLGTYVLLKRNVDVNDAGTYTCALTQELKQDVDVQIKAAPRQVLSLTSSPFPLLGSELVLSCVVKGWDHEVTFLHNNTLLGDAALNQTTSQPQVPTSNLEHNVNDTSVAPESETLSNDSGESVSVHQIVLHNLTLEHSGDYTCRTAPDQQKIVNVRVHEVKVSFASEREIWKGSSLTLNCSIVAPSLPGMQIVYQRNGASISTVLEKIEENVLCFTEGNMSQYAQDDLTSDCDAHRSTSRNYQFTLSDVDQRVHGIWNCAAEWEGNRWMSNENTLVTVLEPPHLIYAPDSVIHYTPGSPLVLECNFSGAPEPSVEWTNSFSPNIVLSAGSGLAVLEILELEESTVFICTATVRDWRETVSAHVLVPTQPFEDFPTVPPIESNATELLDYGESTTERNTSYDYFTSEVNGTEQGDHTTGDIFVAHTEVNGTEQDDYTTEGTLIAHSEVETTAAEDYDVSTNVSISDDYPLVRGDDVLSASSEEPTTTDEQLLSATTTITAVHETTSTPFSISATVATELPVQDTTTPAPDYYTTETYDDYDEEGRDKVTELQKHELVVTDSDDDIELTCEPHDISEISWARRMHVEDGQFEVLFFGSLDLAGVLGLTVNDKGHLRLQHEHLHLLLNATYTCMVFDAESYEDVPVHEYEVYLHVAPASLSTEVNHFITPVKVLSNTQRAGDVLKKLLDERGVNARSDMSVVHCSAAALDTSIAEDEVILNPCSLGWQMLKHVLLRQPLVVAIEFYRVERQNNNTHYRPATLLYLHNGAGHLATAVTALQMTVAEIPVEEPEISTSFVDSLSQGVNCLLQPSCSNASVNVPALGLRQKMSPVQYPPSLGEKSSNDDSSRQLLPHQASISDEGNFTVGAQNAATNDV